MDGQSLIKNHRRRTSFSNRRSIQKRFSTLFLLEVGGTFGCHAAVMGRKVTSCSCLCCRLESKLFAPTFLHHCTAPT